MVNHSYRCYFQLLYFEWSPPWQIIYFVIVSDISFGIYNYIYIFNYIYNYIYLSIYLSIWRSCSGNNWCFFSRCQPTWFGANMHELRTSKWHLSKSCWFVFSCLVSGHWSFGSNQLGFHSNLKHWRFESLISMPQVGGLQKFKIILRTSENKTISGLKFFWIILQWHHIE